MHDTADKRSRRYNKPCLHDVTVKLELISHYCIKHLNIIIITNLQVKKSMPSIGNWVTQEGVRVQEE